MKPSVDKLHGEGGTLVHGRAVLRDLERGDLFSAELDQKLVTIVCNVCFTPTSDMATWRQHCLDKHSSVPGYAARLVVGQDQSSQGSVKCLRCTRSFPDTDSMEEHRHTEMRCVRLVCGQCNGLWSDLEQHMLSDHGQDTRCGTCGVSVLGNIMDIMEHHHEEHSGFAGVIVETEVRCAGDGVHSRVVETTLSTEARFLASEVKPEQHQEVKIEMEKEDVKPVMDILDTSILYKNNDNSGPIITSVSGASQHLAMVSKHSKKTDMSVEERQEFNKNCFKELQSKKNMIIGTNTCDICGFVPYTKNKYREKQDHLVKVHFKERLDTMLPQRQPYHCPYQGCEYVGKDKQDVTRHFTGKHNILKVWVDEFIRSQLVSSEVNSVSGVSVIPRSTVMTFQQMEKIAIEKQRKEPVDPIAVAQTKPLPGLSNPCLTISKVVKTTSPSLVKNVQLPPSISLIRINPKPSLNSASTLLASVASKAAKASNKPKVSLSLGRPILPKPIFSMQPQCENCKINFPSLESLELHHEVCQQSSKKVVFLDPPSPIHNHDPDDSPPKKKRPPPPLIPL